MKHDLLLHDLLTDDGFILLREHPELESTIRRLARRDDLVRILPGVVADPARAADPRTLAMAVTRWDPRAVVCGRAAAALSYFDDLPVGTVEVASPVEHRPQPGFDFHRREIPEDLVMRLDDVALTVPALTAVELSTLDFTEPIDRALRERRADLTSLRDALERTARRRGNSERWRVLLDSRSEPWSAAERMAHRIYHRAGITGWTANHRVWVPDHGMYYLDIAFPRERLATEIDGLIHLRDRELFESDRSRQNALVINGWWVLRFTYRMLDEDPDYVVATTLKALGTCTRKSGLAVPNWRNTRAI